MRNEEDHGKFSRGCVTRHFLNWRSTGFTFKCASINHLTRSSFRVNNSLKYQELFGQEWECSYVNLKQFFPRSFCRLEMNRLLTITHMTVSPDATKGLTLSRTFFKHVWAIQCFTWIDLNAKIDLLELQTKVNEICQIFYSRNQWNK